MAWDWVAPVTTGLVGIAAGLFAWLGARTGANTQVKLAHDRQTYDLKTQLRTERRDTFVSYLAAVGTLDRCIRSAVADPRAPKLRAMWDALHSLDARTQEVQLVGSPAVQPAARLLAEHAVTRCREVSSGKPSFLDSKISEPVITAMRKDLGIE